MEHSGKAVNEQREFSRSRGSLSFRLSSSLLSSLATLAGTSVPLTVPRLGPDLWLATPGDGGGAVYGLLPAHIFLAIGQTREGRDLFRPFRACGLRTFR